MKKNILFGLAAGAMLLSANAANAQETVVVEDVVVGETVACKDYTYTTPGSNWFLQLGAGIEMPMVDGNKDHITANYGVGVGRWFSPYLAWRFGVNFGAYHFDAADTYNKAKMINGNFDLMWDMFNSFGSVNSKRIFSIVPFVGVGATYLYDMRGAVADVINGSTGEKSHAWLIPASVGIQLRFRLSQYVDFFAEGRFQAFGNNYNGVTVGDNELGMNVNVLGGFNINFGGRQFSSFNPCSYLNYIGTMNNEINDLRGELANSNARLAAAEAQLPCPEVIAVECPEVGAPLMSTVRFTINSAKISSMEAVNVYNIAQWLKANPESTVIIKGYADKDTGTAAYNMKLSERRAQSVYNMLTKEYGINGDRLKIQAEGSASQVYDVNNWNRIVIFSQD